VEDGGHLPPLGGGNSQLENTVADPVSAEGESRGEDLVAVVSEIDLVLEVLSRGRQRKSCRNRWEKVQDSHKESLADLLEDLKAGRALHTIECGDTSWDEGDHLGQHPYCACQDRQHGLGRRLELGTKLE
jgi:hypothetical protein